MRSDIIIVMITILTIWLDFFYDIGEITEIKAGSRPYIFDSRHRTGYNLLRLQNNNFSFIDIGLM